MVLSVSHWEISWDVILSKCCSLLSPLSSLIYLLYGSFISPLFPTLGSLSTSLSQLSASSSVILLSVSYSPLLLHLLSLSSSLLPVSSLNIYLSCFTAVSLSLSICCYFSILSSSLRSFLSSYFPPLSPPARPHFCPGDEDEDDTGEERLPSCFDYVMHFLTVFWKVLFACVPPTDYMNGWACFTISIIIIGLLTAVIGDLASHFGCTIGLKDSVTAVVFVALGTSVPGEFKSSRRNCFWKARVIFNTQIFITYKSGLWNCVHYLLCRLMDMWFIFLLWKLWLHGLQQ